MKNFTATILFLLFTGCAQHNAFEKFHLSATKELSEENIQTLKIKKSNEIKGVITVVYLNKVLPKIYKENEYFYIYYYLKEKNAKVTFTLNNKPALLREELKSKNDFSCLTSFDAPWNKYFLIGFKKEKNILNLKIQTDKGANATLKFLKDK